MNESGLSVVLPLYNGAKFVEAAINSIIEQKGLPANWEVIVVDDGSTDDGVERCRQLARQYPQIVIKQHETNLGVAAARNLGVALCRYEYLGFIDQDDRWMPEKWLVQSKALQETDYDYVLGHQRFELQNPQHPPHWFRVSWLESSQKAFVFGAMLITKQVFLKLGAINEGYRYGADDVDWFVRTKVMGLSQLMLDNVVLHRYVHDRNASARTAQSNLELLLFIRAKLARQL
jgi:glycosyltransferase involved in cell wall biosynthesis